MGCGLGSGFEVGLSCWSLLEVVCWKFLCLRRYHVTSRCVTFYGVVVRRRVCVRVGCRVECAMCRVVVGVCFWCSCWVVVGLGSSCVSGRCA